MSGVWDHELLLAPVSADKPCGESLEDTPLLASFDGFRVFGLQRSPDATPDRDERYTAPDWSQIRTVAVEALTRSKDLRVLAYLGAALLRTDGLPAFAGTLDVAAKWLQIYWNAVHPQVDDDAMLRRNALNCFADQMAIIDRLRRTPLVNSRQHGTFALRDVELALGHIAPSNGDVAPDEAQIVAAFGSALADEVAAVRDSVMLAAAAVETIAHTMLMEGGPDASPGLDRLASMLKRIEQVVRTYGRPQLDSGGDAVGPTLQTWVEEPGTGTPNTSRSGAITSRQEAIRALDAVAEFFRQREPSSPVPLFIARARRLVDKDFLEVLADIAPEALDKVREVGGVKTE